MKIADILSHIDLNEIMRAASKPIRTEAHHIWVPAFNLREITMGPMPGTGTLHRFAYPEEAVINPTYTPRQLFLGIVNQNDENIQEGTFQYE